MRSSAIKNANSIIIIGHPKSGKTKISKMLKNKLNIELIHTDDFMETVSWKEQATFFLNMLKSKKRYILEGVQGYRVLRTGARNGWGPDLAINITSKYPAMLKHQSMVKTLDKIYRDYKSLKMKCIVLEIREEQMIRIIEDDL